MHKIHLITQLRFILSIGNPWFRAWFTICALINIYLSFLCLNYISMHAYMYVILTDMYRIIRQNDLLHSSAAVSSHSGFDPFDFDPSDLHFFLFFDEIQHDSGIFRFIIAMILQLCLMARLHTCHCMRILFLRGSIPVISCLSALCPSLHDGMVTI